MITTIQLQSELKEQLSTLRVSQKESYGDIVQRLIAESRAKQDSFSQLLKQGYEEMSQVSKKMSEDFAHVDAEEWPDY